jgi:hypothetical protein
MCDGNGCDVRLKIKVESRIKERTLMKTILTTSALASAVLFSGLLFATPSIAQDNEPCVGENCPAPDMQGGKKRKGMDQNNQGGDDSADQDQDIPRKKRTQNSQNTDVDVDVDVRTSSSQRTRNAKWQYDSGKHQRRRSKSATFQFYYGGYWYPQPYWEVYSVGGRVSCGEGRAIVAERFNRVRVVECRGPTYTYLGRRQGDTYRIILNARTGRIIGRSMI